jgi:phospholipid/cholesterol/gamma-HCH transport system substrate-binding protein
MKKTARNNIKLGVMVFLGGLILIVSVYFIGVRQHLFSSTFRLSGIFSDVNGLQVGSNVRFSGINVGIIENIQQISDSTVQVDMRIEESSRKFIKRNAVAIISSDGLVGNKIVSITSGSLGEPEVKDNEFIQTVKPVSIEDILVNMKLTSENAVLITNDLAFMMENVSDGNGMIGKMFFDSSFAEVMEGAMVNLKEGAGGFKQNMDAASHSFLLKGYLKKKGKVVEKANEAQEKVDDAQEKADVKADKKEEKAEKKDKKQLKIEEPPLE